MIVHTHINKTGGTSIRKALGISADPTRHMRAVELMGLYETRSVNWDRCFTLAFVRNPYTRVVSSYEYKRKMGYDFIQLRGLSFRDWVMECYRDRLGASFGDPRFYMPCSWWICDDGGNQVVDHIYRFEQFSSEVDRLRGDLMSEGYGELGDVPHLKKGPRIRMADCYDDETFEVITSFFDSDFEMFGYERRLP